MTNTSKLFVAYVATLLIAWTLGIGLVNSRHAQRGDAVVWRTIHVPRP